MQYAGDRVCKQKVSFIAAGKSKKNSKWEEKQNPKNRKKQK